jgi:hypothetical protein
MLYFRFKTFSTSYYFPNTTAETRYLYGLYSAYGGSLSKIYWWIFRNCALVRKLNTVKSEHFDFPYQKIGQLVGNNSLMSFNMGSPGVEQKISILGYNQDEKQSFFAKFSQKKEAMELSKNEISVLEILRPTGLAPFLYDKSITANYVFFKTECIKGSRFNSIELTEEILSLFFRLSHFHLTEEKETFDGLKICLAHCDFCPWNILQQGNAIRLIDWETAADKPLGYDLFTYIFQTTFLLQASIPVEKVLSANLNSIKKYFAKLEQTDFIPYLSYFAASKLHKETEKNNLFLVKKYAELNSIL